jgi:hypothetical protein
MFSPEDLKPEETREQLTEEAARRIEPRITRPLDQSIDVEGHRSSQFVYLRMIRLAF